MENYPEKTKQENKIALVAKAGLLGSLAESYAKIAEPLPLEIGVFSDLQAAEDWIIKS